MQIKKSKLNQLIKEELENVLSEDELSDEEINKSRTKGIWPSKWSAKKKAKNTAWVRTLLRIKKRNPNKKLKPHQERALEKYGDKVAKLGGRVGKVAPKTGDEPLEPELLDLRHAASPWALAPVRSPRRKERRAWRRKMKLLKQCGEGNMRACKKLGIDPETLKISPEREDLPSDFETASEEGETGWGWASLEEKITKPKLEQLIREELAIMLGGS